MPKKKPDDFIFQQVPDNQGNAIWIMNSGNVFLKLLKEQKKRRLGYIDRGKQTFIIRRKRHTHLLRKINSYGFNHHMISKAKSFDKISLRDEFGEYTIPVSAVLMHGKKHFKKQGFELQIFLPLEVIETFREKDLAEN